MCDFGGNFSENMASMGLPTPTSLYANLASVLGSSAAIAEAIEKFGARVTVGELIGAGILTEKLAALGALSASYYLGAMAGSASVALAKCASEGESIAEEIEIGWDDIASGTHQGWQEAVTFTPRDPLAIDLDNDGIETVAINPTAPILFDHNGDGSPSATGWLKGDDGWLVNDLDQDGKITSGKELLGVDTDITVGGVTRKATTGFEALRALDSHQDGDGKNLFDSRDAAFSKLRIWQDKNQNGVTDAGELSTLSALGIVSIQLQETATNVNLGGGNSVTGKALVTRRVGSSTSTSEVDSVLVTNDSAANLNLADNPFYTDLPDVTDTDTASGLPNMQGSGLVYSLREAMSLGNAASNALTASVQAFAAATTCDAFSNNPISLAPRRRGVFSDDFAIV